jgi:hypothetical protein
MCTTLELSTDEVSSAAVADGGGLTTQENQPELAGLRSLFRIHRGRILLTYGLFTLENLARLAHPFVLGLAVHDLLSASYRGLLLFVLQHAVYVLVSGGRRMYDTRAFSHIYTDLASRLVLAQRGRVELSRLAARSALSREVVSFFERDVPVALEVLYSLAGAAAMLALYDWMMVPLCLLLLLPLYRLNCSYGRLMLRLNGRLNDQVEREVDTIGRGRPREVRRHYRRLARWRVALSDGEAFNFGQMEVFVLGLMAVALLRSCATGGADAGAVVAVFRYVQMFAGGLGGVPLLVQQINRIRDITRRLCPARDIGVEQPGQ